MNRRLDMRQLSSLNRAIVRWSIIELLGVNALGGWLVRLGMPFALLNPASWLDSLPGLAADNLVQLPAFAQHRRAGVPVHAE